MGDFSREDKPRSGQGTSTVDEGVNKTLIESARDIGEKLNITQSTIRDHMQETGNRFLFGQSNILKIHLV